jgi:hypothetical protein
MVASRHACRSKCRVLNVKLEFLRAKMTIPNSAEADACMCARASGRAILLNVNEPETRGVALALQTVLDDLGKGLGPLLVSLMVSAWGACVPSLPVSIP